MFPGKLGERLGNWDALTIQMVWFAGDARRANAAKLYAAFVGTEPDSFQSNKAPTPPVLHLSAASGNFNGRTIAVTVQPSRVDIVVQRTGDSNSDRPDLLENSGQIVLELVKKAKAIGEELNSVTRLALVSTLIRPTDNHAEANETMAGLVGLKLPQYDVTDLAFQINSRVPLDETSGILVNRYLKFGVATFQSVTVDFGNQVVSPRNVESFGASLALDVNILPSFTPLSEEMQSKVWKKLADETMKLRQVGTLDGLWDA
jgi:hypothetical protein